jgi:hypothetical protein
MAAIEIFAWVLIVLSAIKLSCIFVKPSAWLKLVKKLYSTPVTAFVQLVLAGVVLYYLLQSGLTIVQILAVVLFGALLTGMTFAVYRKETISWASGILKKGILKKAWIPTIIWLALIVWGFLVLIGVL